MRLTHDVVARFFGPLVIADDRRPVNVVSQRLMFLDLLVIFSLRKLWQHLA